MFPNRIIKLLAAASCYSVPDKSSATMKRSAQVTAPLLAAAALSLLTGCRRPEMQRCVDEHNNVVDDSLCKNQSSQPQQRPDGNGGFIPFFPYHYYYGGWGGYAIGSQAGGGSYSPTPG